MYAREKPCREENYKPRKNNKDMPSFSSTLLDEIYRSIDGNAGNSEDFKAYKEKPVKRQSGLRASKTLSLEDEEMTSLRRACLVEKWMEKDQKAAADKRRQASLLPEMYNKSLQDNDVLFFSSTSSSSDSSGTLSSSSDTEFFGNSTAKPPKVSCFSTRPKPVRTGVSAHKAKQEKEDSFMLEENCQKKKMENEMMFKSRSRAMKIYANLKKVKQPISPGGRLTSFINSLFSNNANGKKTGNDDNIDPNKGYHSGQDLRYSKTVSSSTCSSASSFSRSCLSKYSPKSREKMRSGIQRTVRFHPEGVIVDEESRPSGKKSIYDEGCDRYGRPPLPPNALSGLRLSTREKIKKVEEVVARNASKGCNVKRSDDVSMFMKIHDQDEDLEYDGMSDSSSDLFEIDHLALFGDNRFSEELPVYETTHFDTNNSRAIASRFIR